MARPRATRRNPSRRCRSKPSNDDTRVQNVQDKSNVSSSEEEQRGNDDNPVQTSEPEDRPESGASEYEMMDQEGSGDDDISSADFEVENKVSVRSKRQAKTQGSRRLKKERAKRSTEENKSSPGKSDCRLSEKQQGVLDRIFSELDTNKNECLTISDILRAAEDYGLDYGADEARDMVRFWDSSGTVTISRETFMRLAIDSKFMVPASQ